MRVLASLLACTAVAAAFPACGDGGSSAGGTTTVERPSPSPPAPLSAPQQAAVRGTQRRIQSYCRDLVLFLERRRRAPTTSETARTYDAVDRLVAIARAEPRATHPETGRTVRELLGDISEDLQGSNCAPNVIERIERGLATLP
jgi:hypothetical protein